MCEEEVKAPISKLLKCLAKNWEISSNLKMMEPKMSPKISGISNKKENTHVP